MFLNQFLEYLRGMENQVIETMKIKNSILAPMEFYAANGKMFQIVLKAKHVLKKKVKIGRQLWTNSVDHLEFSSEKKKKSPGQAGQEDHSSGENKLSLEFSGSSP